MPNLYLTPFYILIFALFIGTLNNTAVEKIEKAPAEDFDLNLQAVLIVGHIEDATKKAIDEMDKMASLLKKNRVKVHTFYDAKADWEGIKKVAPNCSFFIYSGHGSSMGLEGKTGGLCIKSTISTETMLKELRLRKNAMVLFQSVCRGAGSSAADDGDIGIKVAKERVSDYAQPFFKIGASAYYANNYGEGCYSFLENFLAGMALKKAFDLSASLWTTVEFEEPLEQDKSKNFSIASSKAGGMSTKTTYTNGVKKVTKVPTPKEYNIAYIGAAGFTIEKMKGS